MKHLVQHLSKNVGFGMGLELKDSTFSINPNNTEVAQPGMVNIWNILIIYKIPQLHRHYHYHCHWHYYHCHYHHYRHY